MTFLIPLALALAAAVPDPAVDDASLIAIVEANKTEYVNCIQSMEQRKEASASRGPSEMAAEDPKYARSVKRLDDTVARLEGKLCALALQALVRPRLEAAGASPERADSVLNEWVARSTGAGPTMIKHVKPLYPAAARKARLRDVVVVQYTVTPEGTVTDVKVMRGLPQLNGAAIAAVQQWVFEPSPLRAPVTMSVALKFPPD
jgi:TonB family protein